MGDKLQNAIEIQITQADVHTWIALLAIKQHDNIDAHTLRIIFHRELRQCFNHTRQFHAGEINLWDDNAAQLALRAAIARINSLRAGVHIKYLGTLPTLIDLRQHLPTGLVLVLRMDPAENLGNTSLEQLCFRIVRITCLDFFESCCRTIVVAIQVLRAASGQ